MLSRAVLSIKSSTSPTFSSTMQHCIVAVSILVFWSKRNRSQTVNIQRGHEHTRTGNSSESGFGSLRRAPLDISRCLGGNRRRDPMAALSAGPPGHTHKHTTRTTPQTTTRRNTPFRQCNPRSVKERRSGPRRRQHGKRAARWRENGCVRDRHDRMGLESGRQDARTRVAWAGQDLVFLTRAARSAAVALEAVRMDMR